MDEGLEKIAAGSGIDAPRTTTSEEELAGVPVCCARATAPRLSCCASSQPTPALKRKMDPSGCRNRFRTALLGAA